MPESLAILERRKEVARLYSMGQAQWEIAQHFGVHQTLISYDLRKIHEEWTAYMVADMDEKITRELMKLDWLEQRAMEAWARSTEPAVTTVKKLESLPADDGEEDGGDEDTPKKRRKRVGFPTLVPIKMVQDRKRVGQSGNPAFLERIAWCIEMRLRIMGALKPDKHQATTVININWDSLHQQSVEEPDPVEAKFKALEEQAKGSVSPPSSSQELGEHSNGKRNGKPRRQPPGEDSPNPGEDGR